MKYKIKYNITGKLSFDDDFRVIKCLKKNNLKNPYIVHNIDISGITKKYKPNSCNSDSEFFNFNCLNPINENGINVVKIPENLKLFKGMKRTRDTNLDLTNVYGNKKAWYSDFEIASLYARKDSDGLHVYKPQRELILFCLNDTNNLKLLITKISEKIYKINNWLDNIETFIETIKLIIKNLNDLKHNNYSFRTRILTQNNKLFSSEDNGLQELLDYCNYGENWRQSQTVLDNINNIKKIFKTIEKSNDSFGGAQNNRPRLVRSTSSPTNSKMFTDTNNKSINELIKVITILQSEIIVYPKILEVEKNKLFDKQNHIKFTTGYGMSWIEQIKYMQEKLIDRTKETKRFNFNFRNIDPNSDFIGYNNKNKLDRRLLKFKINNSLFGKDSTDLNRISLSTDEDLKMCDIIEEFFNVDGYWSNSVISYFHERGTFPREICIFNNRILDRDINDPMDWVTYSKVDGIPKLPESYEKILYYDFLGNIDTKGMSEISKESKINKSNVPIEPLTYIFRGYNEGDSIDHTLLKV